MMRAAFLSALCAIVFAACGSGSNSGGGGQNDELLSNANAYFASHPICGHISTGEFQQISSSGDIPDEPRADKLVAVGLLQKDGLLGATGYQREIYGATPFLKRIGKETILNQSQHTAQYQICPASVVADSVANVKDNGQEGLDVEVATHLAWAPWAQDAKMQAALVKPDIDNFNDIQPLFQHTLSVNVPAAHITMTKDPVTGWRCSVGFSSGACK